MLVNTDQVANSDWALSDQSTQLLVPLTEGPAAIGFYSQAGFNFSRPKEERGGINKNDQVALFDVFKYFKAFNT